MFTGIVEGTGEVREVVSTPDGRRLRIEAPFATELTAGQSVNVSGACLTVEEQADSWFEVFLAEETVKRTTLGTHTSGAVVNLERSLAVDDRLDGHIVQGHVDGTIEILAVDRMGEDWVYTFSLPTDLDRYVVEKGSIALDGISLTVADRDAESFSVAIIPTTLEETTLSNQEVGDRVNIEVDVLAKYVERLLQT